MNTPTPNPRRRDLGRRCPNESADPSEAVVEAWHNFTGEHAAYRERMGDHAGPPHSRITVEHSCGWSVSFAAGPQSWARLAGAVLEHFGRVEPDWSGRDARIRAEVAEETHRDIARQLDMLASDDQLIARWTQTCDPVPLTVADWFRALASKLRAPAVRPVEPSAVPVEGSGHPRPFVECLLPVADAWCVSPTGHDGPCSPTRPLPRRPILSLDTPEGATDEH